MLEKRDRGRGADVNARPMQYGATQVPCPRTVPPCSWGYAALRVGVVSFVDLA